MRQRKAITFGGSQRFLANRQFSGCEQLAPVRGREADHAGPVVTGDIRECLRFRPPVGGVVAYVEDIENVIVPPPFSSSISMERKAGS